MGNYKINQTSTSTKALIEWGLIKCQTPPNRRTNGRTSLHLMYNVFLTVFLG